MRNLFVMKNRIKEIFNDAGDIAESSPVVIASRHYVMQGLLNLLHVSLKSIGLPILSIAMLVKLLDKKVTNKIYNRRQYWLDSKNQGQVLESTDTFVDTGSLEVPAVDIEGKGDSAPKAENSKEDEDRSNLNPVSCEDEVITETFGSLVADEPKTIGELIKNQQEEESSNENHQGAKRASNRKQVGNQRIRKHHRR